jgi:porin
MNGKSLASSVGILVAKSSCLVAVMSISTGSVCANGFGGPDSVENTIADDTASASALVEARVLDPWFEWKKGLQVDQGFSFGLDYNGLYLGANNTVGKDKASGGIFRFFGSWELVGRGTPSSGALIWKVEYRDAYGDLAPSDFGLGPLGYVGFIGAPWNDQGTRLTNLYWRQRFMDGKATAIGGYFDVTDYVDTFIGGSPWTGFTSLAFSTGSASMFLPGDATLGLAGAGMLTDSFYAIVGITNAYADPTDPFDDSFDRFFNDDEHFKTLELGWTESQQRIYQDNTHVTLWHVDDSVAAGAVRDHWMPFVRGGYAEDGGSLLQKSLSAGVLYQRSPGADLFGAGLNWGQPNESTFGSGLDDQYTAEVFYRIPVTQQFALTPNIEYIRNPALNPVDDSLWVFGLRARLAL